MITLKRHTHNLAQRRLLTGAGDARANLPFRHLRPSLLPTHSTTDQSCPAKIAPSQHTRIARQSPARASDLRKSP